MDGRLETTLLLQQRIQNKTAQLPEFVQTYLTTLAYSKQPKTCDDVTNKLMAFLSYVTQQNLPLTPESLSKSVGAYLAQKKTKQVETDGQIVTYSTSVAYQKSIYMALKSFFRYLVFNNMLKQNPLDIMDMPRGTDNVKRVLLSPEDLQEIVLSVKCGAGTERAVARQDEWKERDVLIVLLLMNCGMRVGALSEINVQDIDMETHMLTIIDKGHKVLEYNISYLLPQLTEWLTKRKQLLQGYPDTDALFISSSRQRLKERSIRNLIHKYTEEALGQPLSPHKLRAAFCTNLYNVTHDIEFVRRAVGHSSVSTTQRYIVTDDAEIKTQSADIMASQLGLG